MNNLEFLEHINAIIYKNNINDKYYVYIPYIGPNQNKYINKFNNGVYIKLDIDFINNSDLLIMIDNMFNSNDNGYEIIVNDILSSYIGEYIGIYDFERVDSSNYVYFSKLNELLDIQIEEDQILNFYQTFMKLIEYYAQIQNQENIKNQIYQRVIEYYANGQTDCVVRGLSLILQSSLYDYTDTTPYTNCSCNSTINTTGIISQTTTSADLTTNMDCISAYKQSMYLYLVQMLSDIDFYNDFMFVEDEPNEDLIDNLIKLIEALEEMEFTLNFTDTYNHCLCSELESKNIDNYSILNNYKKVLNWIKECKIEENTNKIKIYGKQFGELLPNLQF